MAGIDPTLAARALEALEVLGVPLSVAEAHGLACGLLCSRTASGAKSRWFAELLDAAGLAPESLASHAGAMRDVDAWFEATRGALHSPELDFEPALPDDEEPLARRIDALGDFCSGVTYGIGLGAAARGNRPLPEDVRELLGDFQAIDAVERGAGGRVPSSAPGCRTPGVATRIGVDVGADAGSATGDEGAGAEADYVELVEYVRVGVLVMLEELRPAAAGAPEAAQAGAGSRPGPDPGPPTGDDPDRPRREDLH